MRKLHRFRKPQQPQACELVVRLPELHQLERAQPHQQHPQQQHEDASYQVLHAYQTTVSSLRPSMQLRTANYPYGATEGPAAAMQAALAAAAAREAAFAGLAASAARQRPQQRRPLGGDPLRHSTGATRATHSSCNSRSVQRKAHSAERSKRPGRSSERKPPSGALTSRPSLPKSSRPPAGPKPRCASPSPWGRSPKEGSTDSPFGEPRRCTKGEKRGRESTGNVVARSTLWDRRKQESIPQPQGNKGKSSAAQLPQPQPLPLPLVPQAAGKRPEMGSRQGESQAVAGPAPPERPRLGQSPVGPPSSLGSEVKKGRGRLQPASTPAQETDEVKPAAMRALQHHQPQDQELQPAAENCEQ